MGGHHPFNTCCRDKVVMAVGELMVKFRTFINRDKWGFADVVALLACGLFALWAASPQIWPVQYWIDVQKTVVQDAVSGEMVMLQVDRELHRSTYTGSYRVTVRDWPDLTTECSSDAVSVPYDANAVIEYEIPIEMDWWAYGPLGNCFSQRFAPGQYVVDTEHCWRGFFLARRACRSVRSNVFTIAEEG